MVKAFSPRIVIQRTLQLPVGWVVLTYICKGICSETTEVKMKSHQFHVTRKFLNLPLSTVKLLSVMPEACCCHRRLFGKKTWPEPAIKKHTLAHHMGHHVDTAIVARVGAASEGSSSPTWLIMWQDLQCRRVPSTLIKSVPLLNTSATSSKVKVMTDETDGKILQKTQVSAAADTFELSKSRQILAVKSISASKV